MSPLRNSIIHILLLRHHAPQTPRMGNADGVYVNATPEKFGAHLRQALDVVSKKETEHKIIFLKSWNEWGEGNYVEPDIEFGHGWLNAIKKEIIKK